MITIPARVLDLLGGLRETDPPVLLRRTYSVDPFHPDGTVLTVEPRVPGALLLIPSSASALAAVVARHVNAPINSDHSAGVWWSITEEGGCFWFWTGRGWWALEGLPSDLLKDITDPHHALAIVACWLAEEAGGLVHGTLTVEVDRG